MIVINLDKLLTQRKMQSIELAKELGCTVQTVSRIKTGKVRSFSLETLNALCERFDCQPGDVLEYVPRQEAVKRYGEAFVGDYEQYHRRS